MYEERNRLEKYKQTGYYYIPTMTYDLLWSDEIGEWGMSASAQNMRSCRELDKMNSEIDELGCEIILREFCLDPGKYKPEKIKHMSPSELHKLL